MAKEAVLESVYEKEELLTGCQAVSHAVRLADVDVIAAYPIRPYTEVMDYISKLIADGKFDAEYIVADSEHSQFEIVKHAASVGARAFAGSSGTGWMYGFEAIVVTATDRLPVVAMVGNRALDDPGAFGVEHNDALSVRDLGWLLVWAATAQEALDTTLIAYRVAEDPKVAMPCAVALDGAFLTHSQHMVKVPTVQAAKRFLPPYNLGSRRLHPDNPISIAPQVNEDWLMEIRRQNFEATKRAKGIIYQAYKEFNEVFKTNYEQPFFEEYMTEDAEAVLLGLGTISMPAKSAVRRLREKGKKVGFVRLRWFRPFPTEELRSCLSRFKGIGVVDRDLSYGSPDLGGVVFNEVRSCLYPLEEHPRVVNFIAGLGGREISIDDAVMMYEQSLRATKEPSDARVTWVGVRE
ncbi:MAG: pyruvate ferredoxin oxidoreductase [Thaumarchaeota archaeon]|nr:pyruvate ferredoxin oxidoreductase [Nitrososphaerota archaeon]